MARLKKEMVQTDLAARRLRVNGIVQGVGFRPFVFQLAAEYDLKGTVANTSSGVDIQVEGPAENLTAFEADLVAKAPPLAFIVEVDGRNEDLQNFADFAIVSSHGESEVSTLIAPDVSICDDCRTEMLNLSDRRYRYPFINCTNCGPRYTIIDDLPYDRPTTSMRHFKMCPACQAEYDNPVDRRFHAQPNACAACGPRVSLYDNSKNAVDGADPIAVAAALLKASRVLAVKGLGGYHLAADASNDKAVACLRKRKNREEKPLALMACDLETIRRFVKLGEADEKLLISIQRPIVLLNKKNPNPISKLVAPGNHCFGVMLPYTPLHYLLLQPCFTTLVMTSGNLSEESIAIDNQDAFRRLAAIADYFLIHDHDIYLRSDDSIVRPMAGAKRFMRRSRGYAPVAPKRDDLVTLI